MRELRIKSEGQRWSFSDFDEVTKMLGVFEIPRDGVITKVGIERFFDDDREHLVIEWEPRA